MADRRTVVRRYACVRRALIAGPVGQWWRSPRSYNETVGYFAARSMVPYVRFVVGGCAGVLAVVPMLIVWSAPLAPLARIAQLLAAGTAGFWMVRWWLGPLPGRRESIGFVISASVAICAASFADPSRLAGMMGLSTLALIAVFVAFFHGPRLIVALAVAAAVATAPFVWWLSIEVGWAITVGKTLVTALLVIGVPIAVQVGVWAMGQDAVLSTRDELTGLLNRRGFGAAAVAAITATTAASADARIAVLVVDIDRFKEVNDQIGHAGGDNVLVQAARWLTATVGDRAVVGRLGGDEFAVVDVLAARQLDRLVAELGATMLIGADRPEPVTASVGVAWVPANRAIADPRALLDELVDSADLAMYQAKADRNSVTGRKPEAHRP